jgi:hypothetical protein
MATIPHCDGDVSVSSVEGRAGYDVRCTRPGCDWVRHATYASSALTLHRDHLLQPIEVTNAPTSAWVEGVMSAIHGCRIAV